MPDDAPATPSYTMGYSEEFRQMLDQPSAETHASYLLPHLKPGHRVLDFGCGPGTISVGLARTVDPGEVHGIDMEESQIALARAAAEAGGHANATFHVGDVTKLPFEDNFYDTPKDIAFFYSVAKGWFLSPQVIGAAIKFGLATQEQFDKWSASLDEWKADPAASGGVPFGECLAFKP